MEKRIHELGNHSGSLEGFQIPIDREGETEAKKVDVQLLFKNKLLYGLAESSGYDVFILMGESGMVGRANEFNEKIDFPNDEVYQLGRGGTDEGLLILAEHPLQHHSNGTNQGDIGCGLEFAKWYKTITNRKVLLICTAQGGSAFNGDWANTGSLYVDAVLRANSVLSDNRNKLIAVLGEIGANDSGNGGASSFESALSNFITSFREDLHGDNSEVPFLFSGLVDSWYTQNADRQLVQNNLEAVGSNNLNSFYVNGDGLGALPDGVHKDGNGLRELGRRFFDGLVSAYVNLIPETPTIPNQVTGLEITPEDGGVSGVWNSLQNAESYTFEYKENSSSLWIPIDNITVTSVNVQGLINGTEYDFRVKAINGQGEGAYSSIVSVTPAATQREVGAVFHAIFGTDNPNNEDLSGGSAMTVFGDPVTLDANSVTIPNGQNGLLSVVDDAADQTVIIISNSPNNTIIGGTLSQDASLGGSASFVINDVAYGNHRGGTQENLGAVTDGDWIATGYSIEAGEVIDLLKRPSQVLVTTSNADTVTISNPLRKVALGRPYYSTSSLHSSNKYAELIIFNEKKTAAEISEIISRSITRLSSRSITL